MAKLFANTAKRIFRHLFNLGSRRSDAVLEGRWVSLPSGRIKRAYGFEVVVASHDESMVYWWLCRGDRTLIEGPASSVTEAIVESERALMAFAFDIPLPKSSVKGVN